MRGDLFKANPGPQVAVDLYVALLLPPSAGPALNCPANDPIAFVTDVSVVVTCLSAPATFQPFANNVLLEGGLPVAITRGLVNFTWPPNAPPGPYQFAVALTQPRTLNVIGLAVDGAGFSP